MSCLVTGGLPGDWPPQANPTVLLVCDMGDLERVTTADCDRQKQLPKTGLIKGESGVGVGSLKGYRE